MAWATLQAQRKLSKKRCRPPNGCASATPRTGRLAAIGLAIIRAEAGESSLSLVDHIANEIRKSPPQVLGNPWNRALVYADLGGLYLRMGKPEAAASWLEKSAQAWRDMKVAAA